jgi:hypothetical protein
VRDHQLVLLGDGRQAVTRHAHVVALVLDRHRLAAPQERIATECDDDPHATPFRV